MTGKAVDEPAGVLLAHNYYRVAGGEDLAFKNERRLLESHGHPVSIFIRDNRREIEEKSGLTRQLKLFADTIWNRSSYRELSNILERENVRIAHFHNTFPLISPAAYYACRKKKVAVVQSLHNFRLLCPQAQFFRAGEICELCLGKRFAWPALRYSCYRDNFQATAAVTGMLSLHHLLNTWTEQVDIFIAMTEFGREKLIEGGIPPEKIRVKPNILFEDPGVGSGNGGFYLFIARLWPEKGLEVLLRAWSLIAKPPRLIIIGDGPQGPIARRAAQASDQIEWLGTLPHEKTMALLKEARALIIPSTWYEVYPYVVVDALATGTPLIASASGALTSMIQDGHSGMLFEPQDAENLASKIEWFESVPDRRRTYRINAREAYQANHSPERNYALLTNFYREAVEIAGF